MSRAVRSIASAATPGRTAAVAATCAARARRTGGGTPRRALRLVAAGHPQGPRRVAAVAAERAADVEHDRLAGPDHPLRRLVMRRCRVRARRRRSRTRPRSWPSASRRSRTSRATSASVRPTSRPAAIWSTTRSAAGPASAEELDLVGVLDHPELAQDGRRGRPRRVRQGRAWSGADAPTRADPTPDPGAPVPRAAADEIGDEAVRIVGLHPGRDLDIRPQSRPGGRLLEPRNDEDRRLPGDDGEHRQPLERHRPVAGQVVEVRPDADQSGGEAAVGDERGQAPRGARRSARRDRGPGVAIVVIGAGRDGRGAARASG